MTDLLAARTTMALSLGFHILFAVVGIGMPVLMVVAEAAWLRTGRPVYRELAQRWSKGTAVLFAVGAVSGTALSFELGLLWPEFMAYAGPIIGMPFSLEGVAFFLEAIFLGVYLYGWKRVGRRAHLAAGVGVAISGTMSGVFVVMANGWMNQPTGFEVLDGRVVSVDPFAAMFNAAAPTQVVHMTIAAFLVTGFAVAAIHALMLLRGHDRELHHRALAIAFAVAAIAALAQPLSGDLSAKHVASHQPVKLAAMESHWKTESGAPLQLGGWPDEEAEQTHYAIELPYMLSVLAFADPHAEVQGLEETPPELRPPVAVVHVAFQVMVAAGSFMAAVALWGLFVWFRRRELPSSPLFRKALIACGVLGVVALEAGWVVTEVGRQPWIVYGVMRTADAVTPMPGLVAQLVTFSVLYLVLGVVTVMVLTRLVAQSRTDASPEAGGEEA